MDVSEGRARGTRPRVAAGAGAWLALALVWACGPDPCGEHVRDAALAEQAALVQAAPLLADTPDVGLSALQRWGDLPRLGTARYEQFSSRFRGAEATAAHTPFGGKDFNNFLALLGPFQPLLLAVLDNLDLPAGDERGYVLAEADDGPGYVSRVFLTRFRVGDAARGPEFFSQTDLGAFENEVLRIYVDDLATPAFVIPVAHLGVTPPFGAPLAGLKSGAVTSYVPIGFGARLRVALDGLCPANGYFYHVDVQRTAAATRPFSPRLADDAAYAAALATITARDARLTGELEAAVTDELQTLPAGSSASVFEHAGAGTIALLRFTASDAVLAALPAVRLQVRYNAAPDAAIDVPFDAFFGCRERVAAFDTLPLSVQPRNGAWEFTCRLPLPFSAGAHVALANDGTTEVALRVSVGIHPDVPAEPWGYLHASHHAVAGAQPEGTQHEVVNVTGRGRYVGTFLFAAGNSDRRPGELGASLNILEGNETGVIDGETRLRGTGTEDYFNGGFYFAGGPFDAPFAAANYVKGGVDNDPGVVSCCRWHVLSDAIDFQQSFALRFQYGNDNPALVVRYATVAYYYLDRPVP